MLKTPLLKLAKGTHMDAPSHCIPSGKCIHDFDVSELCMACVVIDVSHKCHEHYSLTPEDITDFESKYGSITESSCVMIKTGWSKFWHNREKYHNNYVFPSVSLQAANLLLKRDISSLGIGRFSKKPQNNF